MCSLGSCSRFWRELCGSDCVWEGLCKDRWPLIFEDQTESNDHKLTPNSKVVFCFCRSLSFICGLILCYAYVSVL